LNYLLGKIFFIFKKSAEFRLETALKHKLDANNSLYKNNFNTYSKVTTARVTASGSLTQ